MVNIRNLTLSMVIIAILGLTIPGGAAAQADVPKWNLNVSSEIGESPNNASTISEHQKVNIAFQVTSPSNSNDVIFLPTIDSATREQATVHFTLIHTPTGDKVSKSVNIKSGDQVNKIAISHSRSSGGSISDGEYKMKIKVEDSSNEIVATQTVEISGFYIKEAEISNTPDEGGSDSTEGIIVPTGSEVRVSEVVSDVTRFNDGTSKISKLQDPSIPPLTKNTSSVFNKGIGHLKDFSAMRERKEPTLNDATVASVNLNGNEYMNVGTVTYGIPEANHHRLILTYSMQTVKPTQKGVGIEIVNSSGKVIDEDKRLSNLPASSPRWLEDTVKSSVDRTDLEQLRKADEDILNEKSISINLTEEEEAYINNNFEAYIIYRTPKGGSPGGITVFKPFRSAIYSTDQQDINFSYKPEHPETGDSVQFNITKLPPEFMAEDGTLGTVKWTIGDNTYTTNVTQSEYNTLQTNPEESIPGPTHTFNTTGSHRVRLTVNPPNTAKQQRTKRIDVIGPGGSLEDTPATFNVSYKVLNQINSVYGTVDVAPTQGIESLNQQVRVEVTVRNNGRSQIQRRVALLDTMEGEFGYTRQVKDTATVSVEPQSVSRVQLSTDWPPEDYGNHKIYVVQYKNGEPQEIPRASTGNHQTPVYVEQPATLKINEIIAPNAHLIYDNFNATVELKNVGDLGTEHPASDVGLIGKFGKSWKGTGKIPPIAGGKVRSNTPGGIKQITFTRDGLDYSPNYPGITLAQREKVNSPWDTTVGKTELSFHTKHYFTENNTARFKKLNDDSKKIVDLYRMRILYIAENGDTPQTYVSDSEAPEFEASAYKFTGKHYTSDNTKKASNFPNVQQDGAQWPSNAIPTTNITHFEQPTKGTTNSYQRDMVIRVGLDNIQTARTGTARIKVVSNRKVYYPEDWSTQHPEDNRKQYKWFPQAGTSDPKAAQKTNGYSTHVVGVASVDLKEWETMDGKNDNDKGVRVPIIIPNNKKNQGIHKLTVMVRHKPDYITKYDQATKNQFKYKVDIVVWGDSIYLGYKNNNPGTQYEHEVFQENSWTTVGYGDYKNSGNTTTDINFVYKNVGGAPLTQTIDATFWHTQPSSLVNSTDEITDLHKNIAAARAVNKRLLTSEGSYGGTNYAYPNYTTHQGFWKQDITQTLAPMGDPQSERYQTWTFAHEFTEPGKYILQPTQYRVTENKDRFSLYHDVGIVPDRTKNFGPQSDTMSGEDRVTIMVWDDIKPVSRFHPQDCTGGSGTSASGVSYNQCLNNEYNGLSSYTSDDGAGGLIWEGGAVRFDAEQRERWTPAQAQNHDVSSDNVGVDHYKWNISPNRVGSSTSPAIVHRFNEPGQYTIRQTVRDHDAYVKGEGQDNQDQHSESFTVKQDNDKPYTYVEPLSCGWSETTLNSYAADDTCWNGDNVWSSGPYTSGADITWETDTDENQIGVESVNWSTNDGSNIDNVGDFDNVGPTESYDYGTTQNSFPEQNAGGDVYKNVTVTYKATDFAGNTATDTDSFTVVTDNTNPTGSCSPSSCSSSATDLGNYSSDMSGESSSATATGSASTTTCATFYEHGPNGGIGFADIDTSGDSVTIEDGADGDGHIKVCITADVTATATASVSPDANPSCSVSCNAVGCGATDTDSCSDTATKTASDSDSASKTEDLDATVTVTDYHGNSTSESISAYAKASASVDVYASDTDTSHNSCYDSNLACNPGNPGGGGGVVYNPPVWGLGL